MENDLNKWSDSDLEYEICEKITQFVLEGVNNLFAISTGNKPTAVKRMSEIIPYAFEFRRRHPVTDEFDDNGNGRYV
jgi:hypothetical protein